MAFSTEEPKDVVWELSDLYSGPEDPAREHDQEQCRAEAERLVQDYEGRVGSLSPAELAVVLNRYEDLWERVRKLSSYAYLNFVTRTDQPGAGALYQAAREFEGEIREKTLFVELEWIRTGREEAEHRLRAPILDRFGHYLKRLSAYRDHTLSDAEEKILVQKEPCGTFAWKSLFEKILSRQRFGRMRRSESEVLSDFYHPDRESRRQAAQDLNEGLGEVEHLLTHVFNTLLLDKAVSDRIRRYDSWIEERNLDNEIENETVETLTQVVVSGYGLVRRYYRLKREILGYDCLFDYDRYAPLPQGEDRVYAWGEARDLVLSGFEEFSPLFSQTAERFFRGGWIHAPAAIGKKSGAFSHSCVPSVHPYILMNFTGRFRDVMTLAHELGHGVHQWMCRDQGFLNSGVPLTLAETASVFGEMLIFEKLLNNTRSPTERLRILCSKIEDAFATVFRQIAMHRFEERCHRRRRKGIEPSGEEFGDFWMETQGEMFGDSVTLLDHYRNCWAYIPHFVHTPGYVYAYAFGELMVFSLIRKYHKEGPAFVPKYQELLAAGGRRSPRFLLSRLEVDIASRNFWTQGLEFLEEIIAEAERIWSEHTSRDGVS